jgi:molybdopterin-guanine dinucleotide biosynthesis protein A
MTGREPAPIPERILAVVLAGGEGRRMGGEKPRRRFGPVSLVAHAVSVARRWSPEVAVAVRSADQAAGEVDAPLILDDPAIEGPLAGLAAALAHAAQADAPLLLTLPCDAPRLPADLLARPGMQQGILADLKAAAPVSHPNVVKLIGYVEMDGQRCVVSEYVQGRTFAEALKAGHKMQMKQVHSLGRVLAQVLGLLHGKGMVHGSIQPSNLMVANGVVKVADIGLGRLAHAVSQQPGGTPDYRAPENALDAAGDLYAMAAVLYQLLTGVHPKSQPQGPGLPLPSTLAPGVSEAFDKLLLRCLHPKPALRFASAQEVLGELNEMVRLV